jgi:hypothetical protein
VDAVFQPTADAGVVLGEFVGSRVGGWPMYPHEDGIVFPAYWSES